MSLNIISYLIIFFGTINLLRMATFLVGSDIYGLLSHINKKKPRRNYRPKFSVVIPAYNEEKTIIRCLRSLLFSDYPKEKLQVILVDDGSKDKTLSLARQFKKTYKMSNLQIIHQKNQGKAHALNHGMRNYATGRLVMCLDADCSLAKDSLSRAARYFTDKKVAAVASNVKILEDGSLINLIQKFEYLICYQMKRAQTIFNIEYIIGGIGSTFRHSILKKINYYDTNTMTEDIDITMKILRLGNKKYKVIYGADIVSFAESVQNVSGLLKQRYRWKYGRSQTFLKNWDMFFNRDRKYTKGLTFFYLPFALFCDLAFLFEPLMVGYLLYIILTYRDVVTFMTAFTVIFTYMSFNILAEDTLKVKEKMKLLALAPTMYFFFYFLSFVEYVALIRALVNIKGLPKSIKKEGYTWQHVTRSGVKSNLALN